MLPPGVLYAEVVRQPLKSVGPERRVDPLDIHLPAEMTFRISGEGGGFVVFTPMPGSSALSQMGQAPEAGYGDLVLEGEALKKMRDPANENVLEKNVFFYCRAGGKYGKGVMNWSNETDDAVKLAWTLMVQGDGSSNVAGAGGK